MKLLLKTIAIAAAIALGSASPAPAQLNPPIIGDVDIDLCPLIEGIQLNILDCEEDEEEVLEDLCLDIPGIQVDALECTPDTTDLCLDVPGIQLDIGECPPGGGGGGNLVDVCLDLPGIQLDIGLCPPPGGGTDVCPAIPGVQTNPAACPPGGNPGNPGGPGGPFGPIGGPNVDTTPLGAIGVPGGPQACFFSAINFGESSFCVARGASVPALGSWDNVIRSINVPGGVMVEVCSGESFTGQCTTLTTSLPQLYGGWDRQISSIRVM